MTAKKQPTPAPASKPLDFTPIRDLATAAKERASQQVTIPIDLLDYLLDVAASAERFASDASARNLGYLQASLEEVDVVAKIIKSKGKK